MHWSWSNRYVSTLEMGRSHKLFSLSFGVGISLEHLVAAKNDFETGYRRSRNGRQSAVERDGIHTHVLFIHTWAAPI